MTAQSRQRLQHLRNLWLADPNLVSLTTEEDAISAVKQINGLGDPFAAVKLATKAEKRHRRSVPLLQQKALALIRCGAVVSARSVLEVALELRPDDAETLSLLGRSFKITQRRPKLSAKESGLLRNALAYYSKAWRLSKNIYPGINAASIARILGEKDVASDRAQEVKEIAIGQLMSGTGDFWVRATVGEAELVLGELDAARERYEQAREDFGDRWMDLASTRRQARWILRVMGEALDPWDAIFRLGHAVVFAGHMVDQPNADQKRLDPEETPQLHNAIEDWVNNNDVRLAFSGAACGADILFLESVMKQGGEAHIVLPFTLNSFHEQCIAHAGLDWEARFYTILDKASSITILSDFSYSGDPIDHAFAALVSAGKAKLVSRELEIPVRTLTAWDGEPARGPGGTAHSVGIWREAGLEIDRIWRDDSDPSSFCCIASELPSPVVRDDLREAGQDVAVRSKEIKAILFADVSGYTQLPESEIPLFVSRFLGEAARIMNDTAFKPDVSNTWGDALYCVFDDAHSAASFSVELMNAIKNLEGFSVELNIRVGLHAGPLFGCFDPIQRTHTYTGSHVSLASRLEPIATEGQIFASEYFAAWAATQPANDFRFEYLGERAIEPAERPVRVYQLVS